MIVYFSSFLSPHVKPFCDYIYEHTNGEFIYAETQKLSDERKAMGYSYKETSIPYLKSVAEGKYKWYELADSADCILINPGSSSYELSEYCVSQNKIVFLVSERIFKRGIIKLLDIRLWKQLRINLKGRKYKTYLLCLGCFVAEDFSTVAFPRSRAYKFGYFPESKYEDADRSVKTDLVWVGRMINWKRPLFAVKIIEYLKAQGNPRHLIMAGSGPLLDNVRKYIDSHDLTEYVDLLGYADNDKVRELMRHASALISTSTKREGWGAVINEALDGGVPVICGSDVGAVGYLIKDGINGYIFQTNSIEQAASAVLKVTSENQEQLNEGAKTTLDIWNAQEAGKRFLTVLNMIEGGVSSPDIYNDGPMSKA